MRRGRERELLYSLLGDLPPKDRPVSGELIGREEREHYILEKLMLDLNGIEPVPAYFVLPKKQAGASSAEKTGSSKPPVVLFNHSHGGRYEMGKDELLQGNTYLVDPPYAQALAQEGIRRSLPSTPGTLASAGGGPSRSSLRRCSGKGGCCGG